ncbi:hypothetical protein PFISCL1PPCAC_26099, partial [Pristionchus fissidentatus]
LLLLLFIFFAVSHGGTHLVQRRLTQEQAATATRCFSLFIKFYTGEIDFHKTGPREDADDMLYDEFDQCLAKIDREATAAIAIIVNDNREIGMNLVPEALGKCTSNYFKRVTNQTTDPEYAIKGCLEYVDILIRLRGEGERTPSY